MAGPRKVWKQMGREGLRAARCRVRRLMRELGLVGASRGRAWTTTTESLSHADRPGDLVERQFTAKMSQKSQTEPTNTGVTRLTCLPPKRCRALPPGLRWPPPQTPEEVAAGAALERQRIGAQPESRALTEVVRATPGSHWHDTATE